MSSSTSSPATQFSPISSDDPDMVIVTPLRGSPLLAPPPPPPTSRSSKSEHSTPPVASTSRFIHASPISPRTSLLARAAAAYELTEEEEEDEEQGNATELLEEGEGEGLLKDSPIDGQGSGVNERRIALKYHPKSGIEEEWRSRGAGLISGIANMSNSILGAGIIGLPYALREAGLVTGVILIVLLGAVTDWTIRLILLTSKMSGRSTYIDIMDACFGPAGRLTVSIFQFLFAFGGMIAFSVILGDTIPSVLQSLVPDTNPFVNFLVSRQFIVVLLTMGVSYPLSLYRDIEKLSKASALALVSMVVIIVSVAVRGLAIDDALRGDQTDRWNFVNPGIFEAIGVISFAFVCHHNSLLIYGSLSIPTLDRFARVTHISTALSVTACLVMSTSGFLVFTSSTKGNILNNFAADDVLINVARACLGLNMFSTVPLEAFVCREVLESYFWPGQDVNHFNQRRHLIITTCLIVSAMLVSLLTCDLGLILELAGGTSATGLAYIFPAACYLKLSSKKGDLTRIAAWICCVFGVTVMVLSTFFSITRAVSGSKSLKTC